MSSPSDNEPFTFTVTDELQYHYYVLLSSQKLFSPNTYGCIYAVFVRFNMHTLAARVAVGMIFGFPRDLFCFNWSTIGVKFKWLALEKSIPLEVYFPYSGVAYFWNVIHNLTILKVCESSYGLGMIMKHTLEARRTASPRF